MDTNSQTKDSGGRSVLGLVFLTVFLDIVGFSIIFPLFPDLLDHYLKLSGEGSFLADLIVRLEEFSGGEKTAVATLFGGLLGSIYGLLQFLFSTVWGGLSDRVGRRPTLLVTLVGTALSYVLWIFAGSFAVLIAARVLGGIMAGNISTATAAVADTTSGKDRAKGMGIVGMAIGLGFILGPAIGALTMKLSLAESADATGAMFALNPFSGPALIAMVLAIINLVWVATKFKETLPSANRGNTPNTRSLNPFKRLSSLKFPGVVRINFIYLLYLVAFAAIEFTLTFLAKERFEFTHMQMAYMFVFVGFIIAIVQGGFVRRLAPKYGERLIARIGMLCTVPGFLLIGGASTVGGLYSGLAFMAIGSSLVMPCLSALVSRYTPPDRQGLSLGVFRSMGSLSRAAGPVLGALVYWKFDSESAYRAGALLLLIPIYLAFKLPAAPEEEVTEPTDA